MTQPPFATESQDLSHAKLIDRCRFLHQALRNALKGDRLLCPMCGCTFKSFIPGGLESPLFSAIGIVGGGARPNVFCPECFCSDRERLVFLLLKHFTDLLVNAERHVLHVAPEERLGEVLRGSRSSSRYVAIDIGRANVDLLTRLEDLPFPNTVFDVVICNHVVEHVVDDTKALAEIARVLKGQGWGIIQTPMTREKSTRESATVNTPEGREALFGQADHVRVYGRDIESRLNAAGLAATLIPAARLLGSATIRRCAIVPNEPVILVRPLS